MIVKLSPSQLEEINKRLLDRYGETENKPNFRIVWSENELEKRWTQFTDEGLSLLQPEVRELPKYRQYVHDKYILEKLSVVPEFIKSDLVEKLSYEPLWVFETRKGEYLPANWGACKIIIEQMLDSVRTAGMTKHADPDGGLTTPELIEKKRAEIEDLERTLFGNETDVGDALAYREGVVVPQNFKESSFKES